MRKMSQRGDTIVEVLISLAVLSLVLGGAYSIVSSSLRLSRQAQERAEATKLAESQIEYLKSFDNLPGDGIFCINIAELSPVVRGFDSSVLSVPYQEDNYDFYANKCKERGGGLYNVFIEKDGEVFMVNVRWDRIGGGKEQVVFVYRGYDEA